MDFFREGASEPCVAFHENDEVIEYSVQRELADNLVNLSYAQKGLMLWNSVMQSYSPLQVRRTT